MIKWIGSFSLLLTRLRDAWMDMVPADDRHERTGDHPRQAISIQ